MKETLSNQEKIRFEIKRPPWNSETKKPEKTPAHAKEEQEKINAVRVELAGIPVIALRKELAGKLATQQVAHSENNVQTKEIPDKEPGKFIAVVKNVWERLKAAGRALIAPEKEGDLPAKLKPFYLYTDDPIPWQFEQPEEKPLTIRIAEMVASVCRRIYAAGRALFRPSDQSKLASSASTR